MTVITITLTPEPDEVPPGTRCSAFMTVNARSHYGRSRRNGSHTVHGTAARRICPKAATRLIDGAAYCDQHAPSAYRADPYYESAEWKHLRRLVLERDQHICRYCRGRAVQADHVIARSKGGSDALENLVACCPTCNKIAASHVFGSFADKRRFILEARRS